MPGTDGKSGGSRSFRFFIAFHRFSRGLSIRTSIAHLSLCAKRPCRAFIIKVIPAMGEPTKDLHRSFIASTIATRPTVEVSPLLKRGKTPSVGMVS
jgi:hypothetical protein